VRSLPKILVVPQTGSGMRGPSSLARACSRGERSSGRAPGRHHTYLVRDDGLRDALGEILTATRIEDLKLPFAAIATDLATGKEVRLESGPLVPALLANSAVPGLYPHVRVDGRDPRRRPPCVTWSSTSSP
jgi:predicted acylesterase/phospholipase RssA